jgi:purine-binding chemotaxis protein CheW
LQFRSGTSVYGLPVTDVIEIIRIVALSSVPSPLADLVGMINLRGRVIPVFDLCRALGHGERPINLRMYIIIIDVGGEAIGIVVDDVLDVITIPEDQFQISRALAAAESFTAGVARAGVNLLTILNPAPFVQRAIAAGQQALLRS